MPTMPTAAAGGNAGAEAPYCGATLVVCPLVAVIQWRQEIARFTAPGSVKVGDSVCAFAWNHKTMRVLFFPLCISVRRGCSGRAGEALCAHACAWSFPLGFPRIPAGMTEHGPNCFLKFPCWVAVSVS